VAAVAAHQAPATQGDGDDHHGREELDGGDVHPVEAQQALECGRDTHGLMTSGSQA